MKHLKQFCDMYKNDLWHDWQLNVYPEKPGFDAKRIKAVEECQVFVFSPFGKLSNLNPVSADTVSWPFPVCSFEIDEEPNQAETGIITGEGSQLVTFIIADSRRRVFWYVTRDPLCTMSPAMALVNGVHEMNVSHLAWEPDATVTDIAGYKDQVRDFAGICADLLERLEHKSAKIWKAKGGVISRRKPGNPKKKIKIIKPYVIICGKRPNGGSNGSAPVAMVWKHRWRVRGHWRIMSGTGKDRYGHFNQKGRTWVVDHVKGPDQMPLVEKRRIVKA